MSREVTTYVRVDSDNADEYGENLDVNMVGRSGTFAGLYLNTDNEGWVQLTDACMEVMFPTATAKPHRLDTNMRYRRSVGRTATFQMWIDSTMICEYTSSSNSYTTSELPNVTSAAVTNARRSSAIKFYMHTYSTLQGAWLLWNQFTWYFTQYDCSATAGTGITSASVDVATPYEGDTVTFTCAVDTSHYTFDGWYNGSTRLSTSTTYACDAADLALTAKATPINYTATAIAGEGISSATASPTSVPYNTTTTFSCVLSSGYEFVGWYNNGTLVSSNQTYTTTITAALTLTATAKKKACIWLKQNGTWVSYSKLWQKIDGVWVDISDTGPGYTSGAKLKH